MLAINYVNDKFIPAPLPEIYAPRYALLELYYKASANRLTVVCAPAGFGKTVSTLLWVKDSKRKSVWVGLDEYDNAPFVFYKLFCTGIMSVQPDNIRMQEILSSNTFNSSPVEHTISLLMEFVPDEKSYALILDDLHTITNKKILKSLPFILKRMPHSFDILLLSRNNLSEEFTEFVESRNSTAITAKELVFSTAEIEKYYRALGRDIKRAQAQTVLDLTGGWAIGITAMSKSDISPDNGGGQVLENYINKNIWEKWDEELREFMLVTSVTRELDAQVCQHLTGGENSEEVLNRLVAQNSFVIRVFHGTYRYHHLFSDFLRCKLKERPDINVSELNLKIANLYYERKDYFTALDYYVLAENHNGIMLCITKLNIMYQDFSVEEWLNFFTVFVYNRLPDEFVKENISLVMEYAWTNFLYGNAEATLHYIDMMNDYIASEKNMDSLIEHNVIGFASIIGFSDFRRSVYQYSEEFAQWIKTLPEQNHDDYIKMYATSITQNFPIMHRSIFDCLEIVLDMDSQLKAIKETFGIFFPNEADQFCYCVKAGLYYEQDELEKAYETIILAQRELKKDLRFEFQFCVFMLLSQILNAMEKKKESESTRKSFFERIKKENATYLYPNHWATDIKHRLWDADREAAKLWFEQFFVTDDEHLLFYKLYQYFTTARAYIVLSNPEKAMEYIEKLKRLSSEYRRPLDVAEACVLQAALEWATGLKKEAVQTLEGALLEMQNYHAVRIIADEGEAVLPILKKINAKINRADYQGQLDRHYLKQVYLCAYKVSKKHKGITAYLYAKPVKLSKQQKHILSLLAQGYKNAEIVNMTGLTINTIKAHTKMIYTKLDVNKSADAILKAKSLGLIELKE